MKEIIKLEMVGYSKRLHILEGSITEELSKITNTKVTLHSVPPEQIIKIKCGDYSIGVIQCQYISSRGINHLRIEKFSTYRDNIDLVNKKYNVSINMIELTSYIHNLIGTILVF